MRASHLKQTWHLTTSTPNVADDIASCFWFSIHNPFIRSNVDLGFAYDGGIHPLTISSPFKRTNAPLIPDAHQALNSGLRASEQLREYNRSVAITDLFTDFLWGAGENGVIEFLISLSRRRSNLFSVDGEERTDCLLLTIVLRHMYT
jgi:hypothetical protein